MQELEKLKLESAKLQKQIEALVAERQPRGGNQNSDPANSN